MSSRAQKLGQASADHIRQITLTVALSCLAMINVIHEVWTETQQLRRAAASRYPFVDR
jgi:hypothetical protein